jgi:hypothetical protein
MTIFLDKMTKTYVGLVKQTRFLNFVTHKPSQL